MRGNIGGQVWGQGVLQEQSDEALSRRNGQNSNPDCTRIHRDLIEDWVHGGGAALSCRLRDHVAGANNTQRNAACSAALTNPPASPRATCTHPTRPPTASSTCGSTTARVPASTAAVSAR